MKINKSLNFYVNYQLLFNSRLSEQFLHESCYKSVQYASQSTNLLIQLNVLQLIDLINLVSLRMKKQGQLKREDVPLVIEQHLPQYKNKLLKIKSTIGMTNQTFTVTGQGVNPVIFRILNPIIDRKYQNKVLERLDAQKLCPKNIYNSEDYRIEQFVSDARHPTVHEIMNSPNLLQRIITKLYQVHSVQLPPELDKKFFDNTVFSQQNKQKYIKTQCQQKNKQKQHLQLKNELISLFDQVSQSIKKHFHNRSNKLCLCHNDVNNNNIFLKLNEGKQELVFIDFQYACLNFSSYDIANLLNECCFEYKKQMPGFKVYKKVSEQQIKEACEFYPGNYKKMHRDVKFMLGICNFFWALWSLQAHASASFSPIQHGKCRLELYKHYVHAFPE